MFNTLCSKAKVRHPGVLEAVIEIGVEIAREGREGRRIGTIFTVGDHEAVLKRSRTLILDPLAGHADEDKHITNRNLRGTVKELAQLDGGFIVSDDGIVISACRYLDATTSDVELAFGLGSRHLAGASVSRVTCAVAVVISESSMVRVFERGVLIGEIIPEVWLLNRHNVQLRGAVTEEHEGDMTVLTTQKMT
ncbi:MAG: diadenylate cyclase [Pyrinomonadaceae bacterium MAG19_C2-C3]|nr:diadenylate cyclase [Pyrinomonadaceae bacterium MAG19_C2-C3]